MAKILVLAHGFLGFGTINILGWELAAYFRGVAAAVDPAKLKVIQHSVPPAGSVQLRANALADYLLSEDVSAAEDEFYIIAHSMGGLDMRQALYDNPILASRVRALVTIATPHGGSAVADTLINLLRSNKPVNPVIKSLLPSMDQGLQDLTTQAGQAFNAVCADRPNIRYYCIAGHANKTPKRLTGPLLLVAKLGGFEKQPCDGLVTLASATREGWTRLPDWELDHIAQVGWFSDLSSDNLQHLFDNSRYRDHINRYMALIAQIVGEDEENFRAATAIKTRSFKTRRNNFGD